MALHELLADRREEVMRRWKAQAHGVLAPESMPHIELLDHLPQFLQEIVAVLREDAGLSSVGPGPEDEGSTAAGHGEQRLRLGFSLDSVVREYGALRDAILTTAQEAGLEVTFREREIVFNSIISGIAHAVSEYTHQRDADMLRQANEHFAFIAHELRDPLSSATMAFQILKDQGQLPAEGRAVGALQRGLQRLGELIDQTLHVARVASGIEVSRQWTSLRELFEDAEQAAMPSAESKDVKIRLAIDEEVSIHVDLRLVRSALRNLLRNAVKFTPAGSLVEMRGCLVEGRAVLEIEDRCGGLPPGKVEAAFAPFVRLDDRQGGFGLGLAIAKQAVDAHGGSIRVQNLPGKGCIFVLELPTEVSPPPGEAGA